MLTKSRTKKKSRIQLEATDDAEQWLLDNKSTAIDEILSHAGWWFPYSGREPWPGCPIPELSAQFKSKGATYTLTFLEVQRRRFSGLEVVHANLRYSEGVCDGTHWAKDFSTPEQRCRLDAQLPRWRGLHSYYTTTFDDWWTPALAIATTVLGDAYPVDEESNAFMTDCKEFLDFWQPFVNEPMADVVSAWGGGWNGHKLQDRNYGLGFLDGALGLSEQMKMRLSDRLPIDVS